MSANRSGAKKADCWERASSKSHSINIISSSGPIAKNKNKNKKGAGEISINYYLLVCLVQVSRQKAPAIHLGILVVIKCISSLAYYEEPYARIIAAHTASICILMSL